MCKYVHVLTLARLQAPLMRAAIGAENRDSLPGASHAECRLKDVAVSGGADEFFGGLPVSTGYGSLSA